MEIMQLLPEIKQSGKLWPFNNFIKEFGVVKHNKVNK